MSLRCWLGFHDLSDPQEYHEAATVDGVHRPDGTLAERIDVNPDDPRTWYRSCSRCDVVIEVANPELEFR